MPSVKIRVQSVNEEELNAQAVGQEVSAGAKVEKLAVASIFAHQAISLSKQIVSAGISNIGNFTGDYVKQDQIQNAISIGSDLATIGFGFAAGGWVAGLVALAGVTTKTIINVITQNQQEKHVERTTEFMRIRSGNSLENNSRTNGE